MSIKNISHESFIKIVNLYNSESETLNKNAEMLKFSDENFESNVSSLKGQADILDKLYKIIDEANKKIQSDEKI